ncbi:MAG TPA: metal ABC transporter permease [Mycobacteriales bacterium]
MITGIAHLLAQPAELHAVIAGGAIAVLCGLVGWFVVLRGQVFAGDALSHVSYAGATAALAAGVDLRFGLFAATVAVGVVLGLLGGRAPADDVVIGTTFVWVLGLGTFFAAYFSRHGAGDEADATVHVLFGSVLGLSSGGVVTAVAVAAALAVLLLLVARPLLFASLDPAVAAARGVPVRLLGPLFLGIVGASAAEASQAVGALLLFGLLAAPSAAAMHLTARPWRALTLSGLLALAAMWAGIGLSYAYPVLPPSFSIMALAAGEYALAGLWSVRARVPWNAGRPPHGEAARPAQV